MHTWMEKQDFLMLADTFFKQICLAEKSDNW